MALRIGAAIVLAVALAGAGWLYAENRRLERELAEARAARPGADAAPVVATVAEEPAPPRRGVLGRIFNRGAPDAGAAGEAERDWRARRERRQGRIRDFLGRDKDETDEAYHARLAPLVEGALSTPRSRVAEARADWEAEAEVTDEQRAALDQLFADAQKEAVAVANELIASGDLSPYKRSSRGVLTFLAGSATIADGVDARLHGLLSAEQLAAAESAGFDVLEYLALTTPWESLNAPPPAP